MDTSKHNFADLFTQLGLPNSPEDINTFIANHHLPAGTSLANALFWNDGQRAFIKKSLLEDSDWAIVTDELAVCLIKTGVH